MKSRCTRRELLKAAALVGPSLVGIAGCRPTPTAEPTAKPVAEATAAPAAQPTAVPPTAAPKNVTLRCAWWGSDARHKKYHQILDL
ncbi:MAG: hypothetical protein ACUVX9_05485 [Anaerolineae bacterium]